MNIIQPTVEYKVATVAQNNVSIHFSPLNTDEDQPFTSASARRSTAMRPRAGNSSRWTTCAGRSSRIAVLRARGIYTSTTATRRRRWSTTPAFTWATNSSPTCRSSPYIILYERCGVDRVRALARENGVPEDRVAEILPDEDTEHVLGDDGKKGGRRRGQVLLPADDGKGRAWVCAHHAGD